MKIIVSLLAVALIAAGGSAMVGWKKVGALEQELAMLRESLYTFQKESDTNTAAEKKKHDAEVAKLKAD